ncbi:hypothetical protein I6F26_29055 [Ensifer sp. IC3342]|nr:hypothetical protein [Ensifer sp. BRP08]MCA1450591.1 hypothetical protein [Ensifer sp. IC3342]
MLVLLVFWSFRLGQQQREAQQTALAGLGDFTPSVTYTGVYGGAGIALDATRNKFAILNPLMGTETKVFDFADLVAVEVCRDGSSLQKTNRGSHAVGAAVGAALLGPAGLLLGGLTGSKRNIEKINKLSLKVYTNDLVAPVHEIVFHDVRGSKPESFIVKTAMADLDAWHGRFKTILQKTNAAA